MESLDWILVDILTGRCIRICNILLRVTVEDSSFGVFSTKTGQSIGKKISSRKFCLDRDMKWII